MISQLPPRSQARQQNEQLTGALELLAAPELARRLAGIYALENLCRIAPSEQSIAVEVLSAFVRRRTVWGAEAVSTEVQAALMAIGRRHFGFETEERPLDLSGICLRRAFLPFCHLERAFLFDCDLEGALLNGAQLQKAWLARANLKHVNWDGADVRGADFLEARDLELADLKNARIDGTTRLPDGRFFAGF